MIKNQVLKLLREKGKTNYWLYNQMGMSCQNFNRIANNETKGITYENLEAMCDILECTPNDILKIEK